MAQVKVLIVEDDLIAAEDIKEVLEAARYVVIGIARTHDEALAIFQQTSPDLVIMDIQLEGDKDGVDVATQLRQFSKVPIIYLTGNADDVTRNRVKKTRAVNYLLKPYQVEELLTNIDLAIRNFVKNRIDEVAALQDALFLPIKHSGHEKVFKKDILYIEGDRGYVNIYTQNKKRYNITTNLATLTPQLESADFLRISKKYVINALHMAKVNKDTVWVKEKQFMIGEHYRKPLYERLNIIRTKL
ncbi:MAG: response regulator [Bacteroidota bacterium]